jgi:hypothetical protein
MIPEERRPQVIMVVVAVVAVVALIYWLGLRG